MSRRPLCLLYTEGVAVHIFVELENPTPGMRIPLFTYLNPASLLQYFSYTLGSVALANGREPFSSTTTRLVLVSLGPRRLGEALGLW